MVPILVNKHNNIDGDHRHQIAMESRTPALISVLEQFERAYRLWL